MREVTWTIVLAIYLWAAGMAGGAYFAAFLINRRYGDKYSSLLQRALLIGVPLVAVGVLLLVIDLGEPLRAWHLFVRFRPGSPMSLGSWILFFWLVFAIVLLIIWGQSLLERLGSRIGLLRSVADWLRPFAPITGILSWVTFILGTLMILYTGVLLGTSNRPLWSTSFMIPALFVCSAVVTGTALLALTLIVWPIPNGKEVMAMLTRSTLVVVGMEVVVLGIHLIWLGTAGTPAASEAVRQLIAGSLWFPFWGGAIVLGMAIPLGLEGAAGHRAGRLWSSVLAIATLCHMAGAFFLRASLLIGGQG